jgi:hypothetical protein
VRMSTRGLAVLLPTALLLASCGSKSSNPFANSSQTRPPSAGAAILFVSSSYAAEPGAREILGLDAAGTTVERLTNCAAADPPCDYVQVAPAPDRNRVAAIRTQLGSEPGATALYFIDLSRSVETILQPLRRVSSVDWSPDNSFLIYTSTDAGSVEDLFFSNINGASEQNLTQTTDVRERNPRVDPGARTAAYEHIDSDGVSRIYLFQATPLTSGPADGPALPGTPYVLGSDADPAWSPDSVSLVFRRLTGLGNGGLGTWDILTVKNDGTGLQTLVTGAAYRGAPDWGQGRRVLRTEPAAFGMAAPRFLYGQ